MRDTSDKIAGPILGQIIGNAPHVIYYVLRTLNPL